MKLILITAMLFSFFVAFSATAQDNKKIVKINFTEEYFESDFDEISEDLASEFDDYKGHKNQQVRIRRVKLIKPQVKANYSEENVVKVVDKSKNFEISYQEFQNYYGSKIKTYND